MAPGENTQRGITVHRIAAPQRGPLVRGRTQRPFVPAAIIHVDMDAYFASIEQRDTSLYSGKPLVVCHSDDLSSYRGIVAAASYEAREFGIKAGMSVLEAKIKLPNAYYVNGNYDKYLYNTRKLIEICERYSDIVEVYSIDEAFIDITPTMKLFGSARKAAERLQKEIHGQLRITCSIGIGPNRLMAKMASEFKKPAGLMEFRPEDLPAILAPLPVDDIPGVGRRMRKHLDAIGIKTIGHLAETPVDLLVSKFGVVGKILHDAASGIDETPVTPTYKGIEVKSFGQSLSLGKGSSELDFLCDVLLGLCEGATRRMRKDGYMGRTITVYVCMGRMFGASRRSSLDGYTDLSGRIFEAAKETLLLLLNERAPLEMYPANKIGMSVSNLIKKDNGQQLSVYDTLDERKMQLALVADTLKNRYGDKALTRCALLGLHGRYKGVPRSEIGIF